MIDQKRIVARKRSYFVVGDKFFAADSGGMALFDGTNIPHGLWSPRAAPDVYCIYLALPKRSFQFMMTLKRELAEDAVTPPTKRRASSELSSTNPGSASPASTAASSSSAASRDVDVL